jgi:hypothetical protein
LLNCIVGQTFTDEKSEEESAESAGSISTPVPEVSTAEYANVA